jgi:hypothetical protein
LTTDIVNLTCPTKLIFAYSLKVVHRLSTLQDPGWDPAIVRQTVDIAGLLDRCAAVALEANDRLKAETGEDSVFSVAAKSLRESMPNWTLPNQEARASGGDGSMEGWTGTDGLDLPLMDFSNDFWLNVPFNF